MTDSYEVGYRKPPVDTRFQQGCSGNPAGRPKGSAKEHVLAKQDRELERKITIQENGKTVKVSKLDAYFKRIVNGALNNDPKDISILTRILPLLEKHRETMVMNYRPDVKFEFVYSDDRVRELGEKLGKRLLWEKLQEIKKTGEIPDMEEPPDPLAERDAKNKEREGEGYYYGEG